MSDATPKTPPSNPIETEPGKLPGFLDQFMSQRSGTEEGTNWVRNDSYLVRNLSKKTIKLTNNSDPKESLSVINSNSARVLMGETLEKIDQELLESLQNEGRLLIKESEYDVTADYTIHNLTARRISIKHIIFSDRDLFVPAFGSRTVNGYALLNLDPRAWKSQGLIEINQVKATEEENLGAYAILGLTIILLGLYVIATSLMVIFGNGTVTWNTVGIGTLIGLVIVGISLIFVNSKTGDTFSNLGSWLKLLPGVLLVLATGIGLPLVIVYFYGNGEHLLQNDLFGLNTLGRIMQASFISIASMLPAFLFYLFGRQQIEKQKENFYRESMLLDPNVWSRSEAENKYDPLLNSVFDSGNSPFSVLLLVISTALLVMGWVVTLSPIGVSLESTSNLIDFFTPDKSPFSLGFLGVYFFTLNMIYRRYVRADLTPKTYAYITMRDLITIVLIWAISTLPQFSEGSVLETGLSAIAFIIGIFPESGLTLLQEYFNKLTSKRIGQDPDLLSLTKLEGMNLYDQARLLEEGIDNIENLAHHNLMELIVRTRIPTQRLVDMFDQAILYLHLGPDDDNEMGMRALLKTLGVRTATDLIRCRREIETFKDDERYADLVKKLKVIIASMSDDEWFPYISGWRDNSSAMDRPIDDPYQFYYHATGIEVHPQKESKESRSKQSTEDKVQTSPAKTKK
ncbi:MAG TPA: hypothetical protein VJ972_09305 [Anaerolineales bacterium]|nr:hypothetical protein [Anaerolineales bacterium]